MIVSTSLAVLLAALALGYLLGSIPFGIIVTRLAGAGDIRAIGSGNIGATNVLRTGRKSLAVLTLLGDALKGTVAVLLAYRWGGEAVALAAAFGAFFGHVFPVWLRFKGGKGVATFLGCLLGLDWRVALAFAAVWLGVAFAFRYSSLSALVASALTPAMFYAWRGDPPAAAASLLLALLLWWTHRANIARLLAGTEGRIGQKG